MINFYQLFLGGYDITLHKEDWELYKLGSSRAFNYYILGIILCIIAYIYVSTYKEYILSLIGFLCSVLLLKFGEYKGYNEALYNLENNDTSIYE